MADLLYKLSLAVVPRFYVGLTALWFGSCRLEIRGRRHLDNVLNTTGAAVVPFWHYSVFYMLYHLRKYPGVAMVSASRDGEYIARVAKLLGFETVRGSSNRFGVRALKGLVRHVQQGKNAGIVADGSQGPPLKVQPGAILLAAKSGTPLLPMVWAARRFFVVHSWDRSVIPWPFSRIVLEYGEPIYVEKRLNTKQLEEYRQALEVQMNILYTRLWHEVGRKTHSRDSNQ